MAAYTNRASKLGISLGNLSFVSLIFYIFLSYWLFLTTAKYSPDFKSYTKRFEYIGTAKVGLSESNFEPGFYYYLKLLYNIGIDKDTIMPISTFSIVSIFLLIFAFSRLSFKQFGFLTFFLFCSNSFLDLMTNTIRQGFSTAFLLATFLYYAKNRIFFSSFFALLAISFHISAIISIFLYYFSRYVPSSPILVVVSFFTFIASVLFPDVPRILIFSFIDLILSFFGEQSRFGIKILFYKDTGGVSIIDRVLVSWEYISIGLFLLWLFLRKKYLINSQLKNFITFFFFFSLFTWTDYPFRFYALGFPVFLAFLIKYFVDNARPPKMDHGFQGLALILCAVNSFIVFWRSGLFEWS